MNIDQACMGMALLGALEQDRIEVHYQPQADLANGRICGVEALVRWNDPQFGQVPARTIVRVAEEGGLIGRLGERVLRLACAQGQIWRGMGFPGLRVAVNLSARQVRLDSLEAVVLGALAATGLPPANLDLELTESFVMDDIGQAVACLQDLKRHGVRIALDDFGNGYSSLAYLRRLPIDALKIERSFLELVPGSARASALAETIADFARGLDMRVVAVGVEREAQLRFLASAGCDAIQGDLFARPLPAPELSALLAAGHALPARLCRASLRPPAILLVDADLGRRSALGAMAAQLFERGGRVLYCGSAAEGVRLLRETPDIVVAAPSLPDMPGAAFMRLARRSAPQAARILLTNGRAPIPGLDDGLEDAGDVIAWPRARAVLLERMRVILRVGSGAGGGDAMSQSLRLRP